MSVDAEHHAELVSQCDQLECENRHLHESLAQLQDNYQQLQRLYDERVVATTLLEADRDTRADQQASLLRDSVDWPSLIEDAVPHGTRQYKMGLRRTAYWARERVRQLWGLPTLITPLHQLLDLDPNNEEDPT